MCGRSSLTKTEKELEERFKATFYTEDLEKYNPLPNYNVAPTQVMPIVSNKDPEHFLPMRWGLIPFWAKDIKIGYKMINARVETLLEKSAFKYAVEKRRCLVPMDGYYEWKKTASGKLPYRIVIAEEQLFSMAGLWESWKSPTGEVIKSFTIITQEPSKSIAHIHDRMPAILQPDQENVWLDAGIPAKDVLQILTPYTDDEIHAYTVSKRVGNVNENDVDIITPVEYPGEQQTALL
ncbi:MAG: SOS response-associated peptidase [Saprospiraceae bacterium]|nr:SOS response-associated peptidase [Saprospiraceae bacterium]